MKILLFLLVALVLLLLFTGCTSGFARKLAKMPDGRFASASLTETDKFTSTTIRLTDAVKDNGLLTASEISVSHTNPWITKFDFEAKGYAVQLTPAEQRKPLPPLK